MPFEWSSVGRKPDLDEIEVSVFGPGFGECIVIHVGNGRWIIVDSCIDPSDRDDDRPVAERYLRAIDAFIESNVDVIVATHWHDDHVRGLGRLVEICRNATFACAHALSREQFIEFVQTFGIGHIAAEGAKVREFRKVFQVLEAQHGTLKYASGLRELKAWPASATSGRCVLRSLSPSDHELTLFLQRIGDLVPQALQSKRAAADLDPNLASVVLQLEWPGISVLLGADMELHPDVRRGWTAIARDAVGSIVPPAGLYKVAHHGSTNGHHDEAWRLLIAPEPICVVAPFNRQPDSRKLPTEADIDRLAALGRLFLTASPRSGPQGKGRDPAVVRGLRESGIVTRDLRTQVGLVRARRKFSDAEWRVEVFKPSYEPRAQPTTEIPGNGPGNESTR